MEVFTMHEKTMFIFLRAVKFVSQILGYDIFCAVEGHGIGHSIYSNNGSKAIKNLRNHQIKWEEANGFDPNDRW